MAGTQHGACHSATLGSAWRRAADDGQCSGQGAPALGKATDGLMEEDAVEDNGIAPPPAADGAGHGHDRWGSRLGRGIGASAPESRLLAGVGLVGVG
jgi:hypothetical protein